LIDKSDSRKLPWKVTDKPRHYSSASEEDFTIECRRFEHQLEAQYALQMTDKGGTELFSITSAE